MKMQYDSPSRPAWRPTGPWVLAAIAFALMVGIQFMGPTVTHAGGDTGYVDFAFGPAQTPTPTSDFQDTAPTATKPQSKLWFNDGLWWGALLNGTTHTYNIYRFNWQTQAWTDTGTLIDSRGTAHPDCLWDAASNSLYIASAVSPTDPANPAIHVLRYTYDAVSKTYTQAGDSVPAMARVEAVVLDKDTTGTVWVAYTLDTGPGNRAVYVTHSTGGGGFIPPYIIPGTGVSDLTADDIAGIVAYSGRIGVMWSNQRDAAMYFASHVDGAADNAWQETTAFSGPYHADDHINLKALSADPSGQVFAVIKTSLSDPPNPNPNDPLLVLLVLTPSEAWDARTVSRVQDRQTRPLVLLDTTNRQMYVFATNNAGEPPSAIYYKQTSLDNVVFADGPGTPFISSGAHPNINNVTSTKQNLTAGTGLLVEASDLASGYYVHNVINLPQATGTPSPVASATRTATVTVAPSATRSATPSAAPSTTGTAISTAISTVTRTAIASTTASATRTAAPSSTPRATGTAISATATPCTITFTDVRPTDYFYTPVQYLACHGVVSGYADNTFRPYANTTRSQMVKIVTIAFGLTQQTPPAGNYTFADVPPSHPFFTVVETAATANVVSGYTCGGAGEPCDAQNRPYFRPYANVTRGQLSKIVVATAGWALVNPTTATFSDVAPGSTFYPFVETAACRGLISGYNCGGPGEPCDPQNRPYFRQGSNAIRGQIAKIVYIAVTSTQGCTGTTEGSR